MPAMKVDPAWIHGTEEVEGKIKKAKCNYCSKVVWNITRLKQHLARVGTDVTGCPDVPSQVREELRNSLVQHQQKVDAHIRYQESHAENLGPTKKPKLLSLDQTTTHAFQALVPHPASSTWGFSDDLIGKSVIIDRRSGRNSVPAKDMRPMGHFDMVGTFSEGSANISSFQDAYRIQKSTDFIHRAVSGNVRCPTYNHNQFITRQHVYTVPPRSQAPIAYEARPTQIAYPSISIRPSRLSAMCHASDLDYGVWGKHQSRRPLDELQCNCNLASVGQGFQQTLHNSHKQLQKQLGLEAGEEDKIGLEHQPLSLLNNMFIPGTSSIVPIGQTTSNASGNEQRAFAHRSYINLELRIKPPSP
ncbi:hypothetical protein POM88_006539 [Heracleum sosnowskyi]|uniref:BED-type domain-containing protein n=1 Tax=Heracleum sosnowskyi TaxID=360622 RepID=A0AAD8N5J2_9APIA|nr:hypothetical protein POM88_006539 [Heracleum sosnowskyi]